MRDRSGPISARSNGLIEMPAVYERAGFKVCLSWTPPCLPAMLTNAEDDGFALNDEPLLSGMQNSNAASMGLGHARSEICELLINITDDLPALR